MQRSRRNLLYGIIGMTAVLWFSFAAAQEINSPANARESTQNESDDDATAEAIPRLTIEVARDRAELMHGIYSATLHAMHHRYFHGKRAVAPARTIEEDVFTEIERQNHLQSRWISASFGPMSISHEPKTEFEKQASKKIAKGEDVVETVEDGYYRRAGSISLIGGCVSCHSGNFANTSTSRKFAGLIISIPVDRNAQLTAKGSFDAAVSTAADPSD